MLHISSDARQMKAWLAEMFASSFIPPTHSWLIAVILLRKGEGEIEKCWLQCGNTALIINSKVRQRGHLSICSPTNRQLVFLTGVWLRATKYIKKANKLMHFFASRGKWSWAWWMLLPRDLIGRTQWLNSTGVLGRAVCVGYLLRWTFLLKSWSSEMFL